MALVGKANNDVSPSIPSGVRKMKGYIAMGMTVLTVVYFALVFALKDSVSADDEDTGSACQHHDGTASSSVHACMVPHAGL